ncbi:MAG: CBS domain-containing protein [Anaerolineae bacterium]|nr:CBS domain-containing protein [Anaerolineae bacterium]
MRNTLAKAARLSDELLGIIVASGSAAGISAAFNAPIAGAMFALEIILGARFSNRYLGVVVIASVSSNVVSRALLGTHPAFDVPAYPLHSPLELPLYLVLALLCGTVAVFFSRLLSSFEHRSAHLGLALPLRFALGMALTGVVAIAEPRVLGSGLEEVGEAIADSENWFALEAMLSLLFFKLLATLFTLGTGNSGGEFAPSMVIGAMLGGIVGYAGNLLAPEVVRQPQAFALVGMAAFLSGAIRAPITCIILVLEMSNDYRLIVPLMMTVVLSTLVADLLQADSIYTEKLTTRGIRWQRGHDIDVLQTVTVEEVMTRDYASVLPSTPLSSLVTQFNVTHQHGFAIVQDGQLYGIVALKDVEAAQAAGQPPETPAIALGTTQNVVTVHPDDPVNNALRRMNAYHVGRLPVVARADRRTFLGMVRRADILHAYDLGLSRKAWEQHREEVFRLRKNLDDVAFIDLSVGEGAPMAGRTLKEFPYSDDCLLVSVRRGGKSMIAHGDTLILPGDRLTAYASEHMQDVVRAQFGGLPAPQPEPDR